METGRGSLTDGVVVLDRFRAEDMGAHLAGEDEEQARRFGWWPKCSGPDQFRRLLAEDERGWCDGGSRRRFAARVGGTLVGGCELRVRGTRAAEASYWTFPDYRGRGYAVHCLDVLCRWAFDELGLDLVEVHIEGDNTPSRRVAAKAGFADTGRRTDDRLRVYERRRPGGS